jgi:hypothetical protein
MHHDRVAAALADFMARHPQGGAPDRRRDHRLPTRTCRSEGQVMLEGCLGGPVLRAAAIRGARRCGDHTLSGGRSRQDRTGDAASALTGRGDGGT